MNLYSTDDAPQIDRIPALDPDAVSGDRYDRLSELLLGNGDAEAGTGRNPEPSVLPPRCVVGKRRVVVTVEVRRREQELGARAAGGMRDRRRRDVAAPRIFERHRDAERFAEIAHLFRLR